MTNDNLYIRRKHEKKKVQISFISVKKIIRIVSEIFFISSGKITDGTITKAQLIYKSVKNVFKAEAWVVSTC